VTAPPRAPRVRAVTVCGEVSPADLGPALAHEHLHCDFSVTSGREDNVLTDAGAVARDLAAFRAAGGATIVELTPEGLGRDPERLRHLSAATGVHVISGIALYAEETYPFWARTATVGQLADFFVRHLEDGVNGVRAGVIGELFSHNEPDPRPVGYRLSEPEGRAFAAAALAQRRTGTAISTHAALGRAGHAQLDALERAGADLSRVIIGHCDAHCLDLDQDLAYYLPMLERGAYCQFDMIGWAELAPDAARAERIAMLVRLGYGPRIMLGTDTCRRSHLKVNGGRGLDYVWTSFLPLLRRHGVTDDGIRAMLVEAPRRAFGVPS
jgi:phosphotriesterase-related protein